MNRRNKRNMFEAMVVEYTKDNKDRGYPRDFYYHDRNTIEDYDVSLGFVWILRDNGTHLYWSKSHVDSLRPFVTGYVFSWDNVRFFICDYAKCALREVTGDEAMAFLETLPAID